MTRRLPFQKLLCQGVGESTTPSPWFLHFTLDILSVKEISSTIFFKPLVWLDLGLNSGLPGHWRTLYPLGQWARIHKWNIENVIFNLCDCSKINCGISIDSASTYIMLPHLYIIDIWLRYMFSLLSNMYVNKYCI